MGTMKSGIDRRDEVLGSRLREAMEDLASKGEPDFASVELAAGSEDAMSAPDRTARRRPSRALLLIIPTAAAVALAVGLGWNRLAATRAATDNDPGMDGTPSGSCLDGSRTDPLGTEVFLLARESVGGDLSLPPADSGVSDSFHEELAVFVTDLWNGPDTQASLSRPESSEGAY